MAESIAFIVVAGLVADWLFRKFRIPGLVGMLIVGVIVGPHVLSMVRPEMMAVSEDFRRIALIVILLRAGFELRRDTLNRVGRAAVLMSIVPALFEIGGVMLVAPKWLGMGLLESAILGAILAAVSPAVVVPLMIDFMDRGRGARKGIPTLILAASSLDDVFVIVLFTIFLGMAGGGEINIWTRLLDIPISCALGIAAGLVAGYILHRLFMRYDFRPPKRTLAVLGVAIILTWVEDVVSPWVPMAGLLGVMAIGFVILEKSEPIAHVISARLKNLWVFAELLLFVLIGAQVNISVAWDAGAAALAVIGVGLAFRSVGTWVSLVGTGYTGPEKLFCVVAYLPKATVQAAIGAIPLAAGVAGGEVILAVAVLSILVTAPLGAVGIMFLGERVLDQGKHSTYRFKDLRERLGLPHVGERVREKEADRVWKVIEQREDWMPTKGDGEDAEPAIYLRLWREDTRTGPGTGKTRTLLFSPEEPAFTDRFEVLYDW
ncbi:MAG: cation:proton antiporter [Desulfatibacillaceae bacterium]